MDWSAISASTGFGCRRGVPSGSPRTAASSCVRLASTSEGHNPSHDLTGAVPDLLCGTPGAQGRGTGGPGPGARLGRLPDLHAHRRAVAAGQTARAGEPDQAPGTQPVQAPGRAGPAAAA